MGATLLALLLSLCPAARAATADPSLMPEFEQRRRAPKPAAAPRRASPAPEPNDAPAPPDEAPPPPPVRPPKLDRPDQREEVEEIPRREWISVRGRAWILSGTQETRFESRSDPNHIRLISGQGDVWEGNTYNTRLRGVLPVAEVEVAPLTWFSIVGEYGTGAMKSRGWASTDWIDSPHGRVQDLDTGFVWDSPGHAETSHASAGVDSARTTWACASAAFRLVESRGGSRGKMEYDHSIDLLLGAHQFKDEFTAHDPLVDGDTGAIPSFFPVGTRFAGPGLHQKALWRGPHMGLRLQSETTQGFGFNGLVLWSPLMEYRGDVDELVQQNAGQLRTQNPTTLERAHGTAIHFRVGASWRWEFLTLEGGYTRLYFYSRTGFRRRYDQNNASSDQLMDHAITERGGFYAGASARF